MQERLEAEQVSRGADNVRGLPYTRPVFWEINAKDAESNINPGPEIVVLIS